MILRTLNVKDGYFRVSSDKESKLRVTKDNMSYTYDIRQNEITIPLQMGSGTYQIRAYRWLSGKRYMQADYAEIRVRLRSADAPFLHSNVYVDYTDSDFERVGLKSIPEIKNYVVHNFAYDYVKTAMLKDRKVLPDIRRCIRNHKGICQDLAASAVALFRVNKIPAKLVIGYADKNYHAWVKYWDNGWILFDPTNEIRKIKAKKYTAERWY